jgi:hypothetical protein
VWGCRGASGAAAPARACCETVPGTGEVARFRACWLALLCSCYLFFGVIGAGGNQRVGVASIMLAELAIHVVIRSQIAEAVLSAPRKACAMHM